MSDWHSVCVEDDELELDCDIELLCDLRDDREIRFVGSLKFDTGADITCIPAFKFGVRMPEESNFLEWLQRSKTATLLKAFNKNGHLIAAKSKGIDSTSKPIVSYLVQTDHFIIYSNNGDFDLGSVPIYVTFDQRFKRPLFGKDLMKLLNINIDNDKSMLSWKHTDAALSYRNECGCIDPAFYNKLGFFNKSGIHILENKSTLKTMRAF